MINLIFSVYDEKARAYLPPFYFNQVGQATRVFTDCVNSDEHQFGNHPHDYTLFQLGTYNDENAEIASHAPKSLGNGVEFISQPVPGELPNAQISDATQLPERPEGGD